MFCSKQLCLFCLNLMTSIQRVLWRDLCLLIPIRESSLSDRPQIRALVCLLFHIVSLSRSLTPVTLLHVCQYVLNSTFGRTALCSGEAAALMFLSLLSQKWNKLQQKSQEETVKILRTLKCMPTRFKDMRLPTEVKRERERAEDM